MTCMRFLAILFLFSLVAAGAARAQPSFDCTKAQSEDEIAICADPLLAEMDVMVSNAYKGFEPEFQPKKSVARQYLADRQSCGGDKACIAGVLSGAYQIYSSAVDPDLRPEHWPDSTVMALFAAKAEETARNAASKDQPMPEMSGQCAATQIESVTTRFGDPADASNADAGTSISFTNDGFQISYDRDGLESLKAGHAAVLCLMNVPHDCPAGDDRGRTYFGLDLETGARWMLGDTQHSCGGA
jgi:uncharacterized protein